MNPNNNPLFNYMMNYGSNVAKSANDILKGTGLQGVYNTQVATGNAATQAGQGVVDKALAGPVDGSYVNAAPMQDTQNQAMIKDSSMPVNLLLGILQQASQGQQGINSDMTSSANAAMGNATTQRGQNLQYGIGDQYGNISDNGASGGGLNGQQAVVAVSNGGGQDLLNGLSPAQQYTKAQQILAAGGVGNWRKMNPGTISANDTQRISAADSSLKQINQVTNQLQNSKTLKTALDTPGVSDLVKFAMATGQSKILKSFGLSDNDLTALDFLTQLGVKGDAASAGGPVKAYLARMLGPANAGLDKGSTNNINLLNQTRGNIMDDLKSYAKQKGYNSYGDLPGLSLGKIKVVAPNGQSGYIDQGEFSDALKNGWKEAQ